jgi:hypothetical protein
MQALVAASEKARTLLNPIAEYNLRMEQLLNLKTEMALDSARVRSGSVSFSIRVESFSGIDSSR